MAPMTSSKGEASLLVSAADPRLVYTGRVDMVEPNAPILIWAGTTISARFEGTSIGVKLKNEWGQNFFNVIVDGEVARIGPLTDVPIVYPVHVKAGKQVHTLELYKRTEATQGNASFMGLVLPSSGKMHEARTRKARRVEFYGDSISVGACNEDPGEDQWDDFSTHNNYNAYTAMTARAFSADAMMTAVSGIGVSASWEPITMPQVYDRLYPRRDAPAWDYKRWTADVVVVNLGTNDENFPRSQNRPFPSEYVGEYATLIRNIRNKYPKAEIFCVLGGMEVSPELANHFQRALREVERDDKKVHGYVFDNRINEKRHPRVDTHRKMAEGLVAEIKKVIWMD